jgi:hypothetical protein
VILSERLTVTGAGAGVVCVQPFCWTSLTW